MKPTNCRECSQLDQYGTCEQLPGIYKFVFDSGSLHRDDECPLDALNNIGSFVQAVLVFKYVDADYEYVPFSSLDDAQACIEKRVSAGFNPEHLEVFLDESICADKRDVFWNSIMPLGAPYLYALSPAVLLRATKP